MGQWEVDRFSRRDRQRSPTAERPQHRAANLPLPTLVRGVLSHHACQPDVRFVAGLVSFFGREADADKAF